MCWNLMAQYKNLRVGRFTIRVDSVLADRIPYDQNFF